MSWSDAGFDRFYRETSPGLYRYLCRVGGDMALAQDLVQTAYLKLLLKPPAGEATAQRRVYLYRVATRLLFDRGRWQTRQRGLLERFADWQGRRVPDGAAAEAATEARQVLAAATPRQRALLWLAYAEGREHAEIARILELRPGSVAVLLHRARRKLRKRLGAPDAGLEVSHENG